MKLVNVCAVSVLFVLGSLAMVSEVWASQSGDETGRAMSKLACDENLVHLQEEMEVLLKSVYVNEFRETIRRSLTASIPDAIAQIDGLKKEIESLRQEIQHQVRVEKSAEFILRDITKTTEGPFTVCRRGEVGGYCETLERYYMAKASNLANRGFLQALECYQERGSK